MAASYSCEICGADGLSDEEMRSHVVEAHLAGERTCPYCQLATPDLLGHVATAHLDYLTPESEDERILLAIGEEDEDLLDRTPPANNNNNNNNFEGAGGGWGSPMRGRLALDLRGAAAVVAAGCASPPTPLRCPLCSHSERSPGALEEHINRAHFDLTSPSLPPDIPQHRHVRSPGSDSVYSCPLCAHTFENTPDLELHVNIEHKDILSPAKPLNDASNEHITNVCPICCMTNFKTTEDLAIHIDDHFNQKGMSPLTPDVSCDRLLAKEMEKRDKEVRRLREQHEFELLRAQYGMDNEGNFKEQSLTNMQRAVYSGELSVADYYERQIELRMAESSGIDDGSSCTKDVVTLVMAVSTNTSNVVRTLLCTTVDHYASTYGDRGWGCGYRNMQMMLSCLVHHTGYNEQLYKQWLVGREGGEALPSRSAMPSISRLQQHIEWAWRQGFDTQGCEQLGAKLANTRKWIGATEVVTVLSSLRIRCQLIDFHRPTSPNGSHPELFSWVLDYFQAFDDFKPPLYLQHQGHSRTIIGVEQLRDGGVMLLVLDPSHSTGQMAELRSTSTAPNAMRLLRKPLVAMKAKQYQIVAVSGIMDSEVEYQNSKVLRSVRIPNER